MSLDFFIVYKKYFKPFLLQTKYSLSILFPLNPLIPILSMVCYVVEKLNSVSKNSSILSTEFFMDII